MNHTVNYGAEEPKLRAFGASHGLDLSCGFDGWVTRVALTRVRSLAAVVAEVGAARASWREAPPPAGEAEVTTDAAAGVPCFRYDTVPGLDVWEPGQSPSPPWRRPG